MKNLITKKASIFYIIAATLFFADLLLYVIQLLRISDSSWIVSNLSTLSGSIIPSVFVIVALIVCAFAKNKVLLPMAFSVVAYEGISSLWYQLDNINEEMAIYEIFFCIGTFLEVLASSIIIFNLTSSKAKNRVLLIFTSALPFVCMLGRNMFHFLGLLLGAHLPRYFLYAIAFLFVGLGMYFELDKKEEITCTTTI